MNIMEVWTMEDNAQGFTEDHYIAAVCHAFKDRNEGNKFFKLCQAENKPMITRNNNTIRYWNSERTDWLAPMIRADVEGTDWKTSVEFDVLYSVYNKQFDREKNGEDSFCVSIDGELYCVVGEYCREDEQLADMYGSKDKYYRYTFWDSDNNDLSCFCIEA